MGLSGLSNLIVASMGLRLVRLLRQAMLPANLAATQALRTNRAENIAARESRYAIGRPAAILEPRPHIHPTPRIEPRLVIHPSPRILPLPPPICPEPTEPSHIIQSPIQPPWKILPWQNPPSPPLKIKIVVRPPDVHVKGTLFDVFI